MGPSGQIHQFCALSTSPRDRPRSISRPRPGGCSGGVSTTGDGGAGLLPARGAVRGQWAAGCWSEAGVVGAVWMRLRSELRTRWKVISGRMANQRAPGEAMIDFPTADREGLRVGSVVKYIVGSPKAKPAKLAAVRIVGIVASPGQFPAVGASSVFSTLYVTP